MPVLFHVLNAVLALSGLKLTDGECLMPHILCVNIFFMRSKTTLCAFALGFIQSPQHRTISTRLS